MQVHTAAWTCNYATILIFMRLHKSFAVRVRANGDGEDWGQFTVSSSTFVVSELAVDLRTAARTRGLLCVVTLEQ